MSSYRPSRYPSRIRIEGIDAPGKVIARGESITLRPTLAGLQQRVMQMKKAPENLKGLLKTGILQGFDVIYGKEHGRISKEARKEPAELRLPGWIDGSLIVCACGKCKEKEKMAVSVFEVHAKSKKKEGCRRVFLDNGKSLYEVLEAGCAAKPKGIEEVRNVLFKAIKDAMKQETCVKCRNGRGEVACIHCSKVYHLACARLTKPLLDWPCPKCKKQKTIHQHKS